MFVMYVIVYLYMYLLYIYFLRLYCKLAAFYGFPSKVFLYFDFIYDFHIVFLYCFAAVSSSTIIHTCIYQRPSWGLHKPHEGLWYLNMYYKLELQLLFCLCYIQCIYPCRGLGICSEHRTDGTYLDHSLQGYSDLRP